MRRKAASACCAGVLLVLLASLSMTGCTRSRREGPTPTLAAAGKTPTSQASLVPTVALTPQPPPTNVVTTSGPTVVSVAGITPSPIPATAQPSSATATAPATTGSFEYTVQWYDTLYSLARQFNTSVDAIVALNGLPDANQIKVGQVLKIPGAGAGPRTGSEYIVQAGDTLYSIGRRYGVTAEAIRLANGIVNAWYLQIGQRLIIPVGSGATTPSAGTTYVVQSGDTLTSIAARYGKNVWDIVVANNLSDPGLIYAGQVLTIP